MTTVYQRLFYIFKNMDSSYGYSSTPSGYIKVEINGCTIKLQAVVQNLCYEKEELNYSLYAVTCSGGHHRQAKLFELPLSKGKADLRQDITEVLEKNRLNFSDIDVLAVISVSTSKFKKKTMCPLVAYPKGEVDWRSEFERVLENEAVPGTPPIEDKVSSSDEIKIPAKMMESPHKAVETASEASTSYDAMEAAPQGLETSCDAMVPPTQAVESASEASTSYDAMEAAPQGLGASCDAMVPPTQAVETAPEVAELSSVVAETSPETTVPPTEAIETAPEVAELSSVVAETAPETTVLPTEVAETSSEATVPPTEAIETAPEAVEMADTFLYVEPASTTDTLCDFDENSVREYEAKLVERALIHSDELGSEDCLPDSSPVLTLLQNTEENVVQERVHETEVSEEDKKKIQSSSEKIASQQDMESDPAFPMKDVWNKIQQELWVKEREAEKEVTFDEDILQTVERNYQELSSYGLSKDVKTGDITLDSLKEDLDRCFESYNPFKGRIKGINWWKINSPGYLNNLLFKNNIKTYLLFNPKVLLANFKYRHVLFGMQMDKGVNRFQLICGVPGVYNIDENPFGTASTWVQTDGIKPKYGAFGYWLVLIDARSGKIHKLK